MASRAAKSLVVEERRNQVLAMRRDGFSERAIAKTMGLTKSMVHRDLMVILDRLNKEQIQLGANYRQLLNAKLEEQLRIWSARAKSRMQKITRTYPDGTVETRVEEVAPPDGGAADRVLRILQQQSRLFGADAPVKIESAPPAPIDINVSFKSVADVKGEQGEQPPEDTDGA